MVKFLYVRGREKRKRTHFYWIILLVCMQFEIIKAWYSSKSWYFSKFFRVLFFGTFVTKYILENTQTNLAKKLYRNTWYNLKCHNTPYTTNISRPKCFNSFCKYWKYLDILRKKLYMKNCYSPKCFSYAKPKNTQGSKMCQ